MIGTDGLMELRYLAANPERPLFGGPISRGEDVAFYRDNPDMRRMLDSGLIERIGDERFVITQDGRAWLTKRDGTPCTCRCCPHATVT